METNAVGILGLGGFLGCYKSGIIYYLAFFGETALWWAIYVLLDEFFMKKEERLVRILWGALLGISILYLTSFMN